VTFKGRHRYLATTLVARPGDLSRSLTIKSPDITRRANELIARMQDALRDLSPFDLEAADVDGIVAHIRARMMAQSFRLDFFAWADGYLSGKLPQTRKVYDVALNSFAEFLGGRTLDINAITNRLLLDWMADTDGKMKRNTSKPHGEGLATRNAARLAHIYKAAQRKYNDDDRTLIPRNPFDNIPRTATHPEGQHNLGAELMQRIIDDKTATGRERLALDAFILSFLLMGANMADLWAARPCASVWVYNRQKTSGRRADRAEMRVAIPPEAAPYLERLTGPGDWWLNALHGLRGGKDGATHKVNAALKAWADRERIPSFTFYAARKTWASLARRAGVEKATIDECLCHIGDFPVADIYIERDWELLDKANRKTIAMLRWDGPVRPQEEDEVNQPEDEAGVLR
jgi:integrase